MFELFSDIYFVVHKLYYVSQNDNLGIRVSLKNWDRWSNIKLDSSWVHSSHIVKNKKEEKDPATINDQWLATVFKPPLKATPGHKKSYKHYTKYEVQWRIPPWQKSNPSHICFNRRPSGYVVIW
jgi:hypothetical protein